MGILPSGWLLLTSNDGVSDTDERRSKKKLKRGVVDGGTRWDRVDWI